MSEELSQSYVVTGASRGIGLEFVRQIAEKKTNQVFALVRNKSTSSKLLAISAETGNVHIIEGDVTNYKQLKTAAQEVSKHTSGALDVLINNAGFIPRERGDRRLTDFENEEDLLEQDLRAYFEVNTIGTIHVTNAFLPLLKAGKTKKVITISTGVADPDFIAKIGFSSGAPYAISKAAVNMAVTKYAIQFRDEDFTFVSISPGLVDTSEDPNPAHYKGYVSVFQKVKPTFQRPLTTQESVTFQLKTIERLSVEDTGAFISHHGSKDWL